MADKTTPAWIPMLTGGIIVTAWAAIVVIVATLAIWLAGTSVHATALIAAGAWLTVFVPVVKLVRADLRGER